jgi:hypothetical protein
VDLFKKENITIDDIQSLINDGVEESLNIEYKAADSLKKSDGAKKEITKDISAFANSNGGVLIYGLKEEGQKPIEISYIDGNEFSKDWLEQVINNIHRKIKLEVIPVRLKNDISKTIYVIKIPESMEAPHMALDGRYYRRMNFQIVVMEEYEVRNLYHRKEYGELSICDTFRITYEGHPDNEHDEYLFKLDFSICNKSKIVESQYKFALTFENCSGMGLNWERDNKFIFTHIKDKPTMSTSMQVPIFPDEELTVMTIKVNISENKIEENLINGKVIETLHYSSGTEVFTMSFADVFRSTMIGNKIITEDNKLNPDFKKNQYDIM